MSLRDKMFLIVSALCIIFLVPALSAFKYMDSDDFAIFISIEFVSLLTSMYLIFMLIFKRVKNISEIVKKIVQEKDFSHRILRDKLGNDEITPMIENINRLTKIIETYQNELEFQRKKYGFKLEKANALLARKSLDMAEMEKDVESLKKLAHLDSITSLPNRISFNETLNHALRHAKNYQKSLAILLINLDNFKNINDELGHENGDVVIKEVINRFNAVICREDCMARFGGAVIVVLLNDIVSHDEVTVASEKLLAASAAPIRVGNKEVHVNTSIGISIFPDDGNSLHLLLKHADIAMFRARKAGGHVFQLYQGEMNHEMEKIAKLGTALRSGIVNNEFVLHFQPKFNVKENVMIGVEALLRWENPAIGLIKPERFIPLAEQTDFIIELNEWVLRQACLTCKYWLERGFQPIPVSVNLSHKQFHYQDIADLVANALRDTQLDPGLLEIEIPEKEIADDMVVAVKKLAAIKNAGVKISIDHYGTTSLPLNYLQQLQVDYLKIDKSFISTLPENAANAAVTIAAINAAHQMGIKAVAMGVECREQLQFLTANGCDIAQGYLFSMPLASSDLVSGTKLIFT